MLAQLAPPMTVNALHYVCMCKEIHPRRGPLCEGCRAANSGRNCWDMAISPCCDLDRKTCPTCPVYAEAMRTASVAERVRIHLEGGSVIEGQVHCRPGHRLSDALNDPARPFIIVTDARILPEGGGAELERDVVLVSKRATRMVIPLEERAGAQRAA